MAGQADSPSPLTGEGRGGGEQVHAQPATRLVRSLRKNMTDAERHLWGGLRMLQLDGHKFRRQFPLGPYIVDFVCLSARLIVEVDGGQHLNNSKDQARDAWLADQGFRVLRFWNNDVLARTGPVLDAILAALATPTPALPRQEGGSLHG
ncbi:MAG: endonuclease domain-containing protein [Betaproteobacteria bacterium]|nr:endonuclease domain-containing protein [Betaproteobacteria bacterium]